MYTYVVVDVSFDQPSYMVSEEEMTVQICVEVAAISSLDRDIAVQVVALPGTATVADFSISQSTDVIISSLDGACVNIPVSSDEVLEESEVFSLVLFSSDPGVNVLTRAATVTIVDNDRKQSIK